MYLNDFATLPGSQALSVSVAQDARIDEGSTLILLLYEDTKGNITMLLGSTNPRNVSNSYTNWTDLSSQMYDAVGGPQYGLKAPMTSWNDSSASFMTAFLKQATPELRSLAEITLISYNSSYGTGFNGNSCTPSMVGWAMLKRLSSQKANLCRLSCWTRT